MRDDQILFFYPAAAVREDVEVERARSPAVRRSPSEASFEGLERSQQRARIELRIERNDRIHEIRLIDHAPGLRSVKTGALYDHPALAQGNDHSFDVRGGVVLVRPDPDVRVDDPAISHEHVENFLSQAFQQRERARLDDRTHRTRDRRVIDRIGERVAPASLAHVNPEDHVDLERLRSLALSGIRSVPTECADCANLDRLVQGSVSRQSSGRHPRAIASLTRTTSRISATSWTRTISIPAAAASATTPAVPNTRASTLRPVSFPIVDFREGPSSVGKPSATIRSSAARSARLCSGSFPNPIPGSTITCC